MSRQFDFKPVVKSQARLRQNGRCACCGDQLNNLIEHAHHVIPNQSGNAEDPYHLWLSSVDNCVILCAMCHNRVHQDGRYRNGAVAPASYYPFSHDIYQASHQVWVNLLTRRSHSIWPV